MTPELLYKAFLYVEGESYFWATMGMTTATAMFIGAMIYDGDLTQSKKGIVSVGSYALLLFWMIMSRVNEIVSVAPPVRVHPEYAYAGMVSIICVTIAWLLGIELGVFVFNKKYRGGHK